MKLEGLVFVTSSEGKRREAEAVLGVALEHRGLDLVEPQSLDVGEVVRFKTARRFSEIPEGVRRSAQVTYVRG